MAECSAPRPTPALSNLQASPSGKSAMESSPTTGSSAQHGSSTSGWRSEVYFISRKPSSFAALGSNVWVISAPLVGFWTRTFVSSASLTSPGSNGLVDLLRRERPFCLWNGCDEAIERTGYLRDLQFSLFQLESRPSRRQRLVAITGSPACPSLAVDGVLRRRAAWLHY